VAGGAQTIIEALQSILTNAGTLIMPTHTAALSEPSHWKHPPAPEADWQHIRQTMPAYDPHATVTRKMGRIPETFRSLPGVFAVRIRKFRLPHGESMPQKLCRSSLPFGLGNESPLAKIYDLDGYVLLLGWITTKTPPYT